MAVVVLDGQPLSLLAHARGGADLERVRAILRIAERRGWPVRVPTTILAELYRGTGADSAIDSAMSRLGIRAFTTGRNVARHAGRLMHERHLNTCHLADATVVATGLRLGGAVVVTGDPDDLTDLASDSPTVQIQRI